MRGRTNDEQVTRLARPVLERGFDLPESVGVELLALIRALAQLGRNEQRAAEAVGFARDELLAATSARAR